MVQTDTLFLRDLSGHRIYQLAACDSASRLTATEFVPPSAHTMRAAFERILETIPVVIRGVQTDNGSEFRGVFDELLQERGIAMQVIQLRSPKQNGYIERCRRTWCKELYETFPVAATLDEYRLDARCFVVHHNPVRPHAAPAGRTPIGYLRENHGESLRRNLAAPAGKPTPTRPTKNARCSDCVHHLDRAYFCV